MVVVGSRLDDVGHRALDAAACRTSSTSTSTRPSSTAPTRRRSGSSATPGSRCAGCSTSSGRRAAGRSADPDWGVARARAMREAFDAGVAPDQRAVRDAFLAARAAMPRDAILTHDAARAELVERLLLAGLRARRIDLAVGVGDARLRAWRSRTARPSRHPAGGSWPTCGDGGFLFTATELATTAAYGLDVTRARSTTTARSARSPRTRCATTAGRTPRTSTTRTSSRSSGRSASRPSGWTTSPTCLPRWPARRPDPGRRR